MLRRIKEDWADVSQSNNRMSAYTLQRQLRKRMLAREAGTHDGSVDLLVTGFEVSLWIGEQFASDLHNAFPQLKIVTLSANKLLSQLGQAFPVPNRTLTPSLILTLTLSLILSLTLSLTLTLALTLTLTLTRPNPNPNPKQAFPVPNTGFYFNETSYDFSNTNVLMISHSGGTFATLNVSNLLKGFTTNLFVVTSEWDTQIARSVRAGKPGKKGTFNLNSFVFTTFCGCRPAEPVSLTAVATHQLLTQDRALNLILTLTLTP